MSAATKGLRANEQEWVEKAMQLALTLARSYNVAGDRPKLTPAVLDQIYSAWLANPLPDFEVVGVFNAIGVAFGQYLVDHAGMRWVVYSKDGESDIAVYRAQGKVVVFPTRLVRKRYLKRETNFLVPMYYDAIKSMTIASKSQLQPKTPWWMFGMQHN